MSHLADSLLSIRFFFGYPVLATTGVVLAVIAVGRLRSMTNGRRRLYRPLVGAAVSLAWLGLWGALGVWQYGKYLVPLPLPMTTVSICFSLGILGISASMLALTVVVLIEEYERTGILRGNRGVQ